MLCQPARLPFEVTFLILVFLNFTGRERKRVAVPVGYFVSQYQLNTGHGCLKLSWVLHVLHSSVDLHRMKQQRDPWGFA